MRGDGLARAQERAFGAELKAAVRNHCRKTQAPDYHYDMCLADMRHEPREWWGWFLSFFRGEIK